MFVLGVFVCCCVCYLWLIGCSFVVWFMGIARLVCCLVLFVVVLFVELFGLLVWFGVVVCCLDLDWCFCVLWVVVCWFVELDGVVFCV